MEKIKPAWVYFIILTPVSAEQVFAIGPGALVSFSPDTHLFLNACFESEAEYRPEGDCYNIRLVHHF